MLTEKIYIEAMRFLKRADALKEEGDWRELWACPLAVPLDEELMGYLTFELDREEIQLMVGEGALQGQLRRVEQRARERRTGLPALSVELTEDASFFQLRFAGKEALTNKEYVSCRAYALPAEEGSGLDFPTGCYPVLRSIAPHVLPMEVDNDEDLEIAEDLLHALNWYLDHRDEDELPDEEDLLEDGELLELVPKKKNRYEALCLPRPRTQPPVFPLQRMSFGLDNEIESLSSLPHQDVWEMALLDIRPEGSSLPGGHTDPAFIYGREFFVTLACCREDGRVVDFSHCTTAHFSEDPSVLLDKLNEIFRSLDALPKEIHVADEETSMLLRQWCRRAGIRIRRVSDLPHLRQVLDHKTTVSADSTPAGRPEGQAPRPDLGAYLLQLLQTGDLQMAAREMDRQLALYTPDEIAHLPEDVRKILDMFVQMDMVSGSTAMKLNPEAENERHARFDSAMRVSSRHDEADWRYHRHRRYDMTEDDPHNPSTLHTGPFVPEKESRPGSCVFSVTLETGYYRHLKVGMDMTLAQFCDEILRAFSFQDRSRSHAFFLKGATWRSPAICGRESDYTDSNRQEHPLLSKDITLGQLALKKGRSFTMGYDFMEGWNFRCKVLSVSDEAVSDVEVLRSKGDLQWVWERNGGRNPWTPYY